MPDNFKDLKEQLEKLYEGSDLPSLENDVTVIFEGELCLIVYETSAGRAGNCKYEIAKYHPGGYGWHTLLRGNPMPLKDAIEHGLIDLAFHAEKLAGLHTPNSDYISLLIDFIYWAEKLKGLEGKSGDPNDLANQWESAYAGLYAQAKNARQFLKELLILED